jgi:hypothetical protein
MFDEFQNGTNTVMNIKCDFVGCENQDSVFCATREKANNTLFERGWIIDSRKRKHFCKNHAAQHRVHPTRGSVAQKVSSKSKGSAKLARG